MPSEFVYEVFRRGEGMSNPPWYSIHGYLTGIAKPASVRDFRPVMDGHTYVGDWRFPGSQPAAYVNTSKDWFATNSPQWRALLKMYSPEAGGLVWPRHYPTPGIFIWPAP